MLSLCFDFYSNTSKPPEEYNYETIHSLSIYGCELGLTTKEGLRSWNMTVQYWLAAYCHHRLPHSLKAYRWGSGEENWGSGGQSCALSLSLSLSVYLSLCLSVCLCVCLSLCLCLPRLSKIRITYNYFAGTHTIYIFFQRNLELWEDGG